ncbi:hypothetical protein GSI_01850 [Ganoderma sinense ZZ0214-1]|uniref:Uncharacterized protein n=1 Tax=Ganoderma sinense ZZ0214-1 TaxID=1077348 RepID=A0A2G8SR11_9APHY|nr:hypothetical protein GSI_01850 [Ganoderma sinense ZZ0214-1]
MDRWRAPKDFGQDLVDLRVASVLPHGSRWLLRRPVAPPPLLHEDEEEGRGASPCARRNLGVGGGRRTCVRNASVRAGKYSTNALVATPGMRVPAYTARGRVYRRGPGHWTGGSLVFVLDGGGRVRARTFAHEDPGPVRAVARSSPAFAKLQ